MRGTLLLTPPPTDITHGVGRDGRMDVALNDAGTRVMLFKNTSPRRAWICITPQVST